MILDMKFRDLEYKLDVFDEDLSVVPQMKRTRCYEPHITSVLDHTIGFGGNFLDIGANLGQHSIALAKTNVLTKFIAIEAALPNVEKIRSSIEINNIKNMTVINALLGQPGEEVGYYFWPENCACAFVSKTDYGLNRHPDKKLYSIEAKYLHDLIPNDTKYQNIKIDVEGSEKFIIQGSPHIFEEANYCVIEINNFCCEKFFGYQGKENIELLVGLGYKSFYLPTGSVWNKIELKELMKVLDDVVMIDVLCGK